MSIQLTTQQILQIARLCQPLTVVSSHTGMILKGGDLNARQALLIYMERKAVENRYNLDPSDPTLQQTSNYLFSLLRNWPAAQARINLITGGLPIISNPADVSIDVGQDATFTVTVTSASSYTVQWFRDGAAIPGATGLSYTLTNAQLSDTGALFSAVATNLAGPVSSLPATLTVTANILLYAYYSDADPRADLLAGTDNFAYQFTVVVTHNQPIDIPIPQVAANNKFWVWRVVSTEQDNNRWFSTDFNNGSIPDSIFQPIIKFGGNSYYSLVDASSFSFTVPLTFSKV